MRLLILSILVLFHFTCISQHSSFNTLHTINNLPTVDNYSVQQDKQGQIWILSENGILKYGFTKSKLFTTKDGLPTNDIWNLYIDKSNRIWLSFKGKGLYYIFKDSVYQFSYAKNINDIHCVGEFGNKLFFKSINNSRNEHLTYYSFENDKFLKLDYRNVRNVFVFPKDSAELEVYEDYSILTVKGKQKKYQFHYNVRGMEEDMVDQKIFYANKSDVNKVALFWKNELVHIDLSKFLDLKVQSIYIYEGTYSAIVETIDGIRFYKNIITKERDISIENVLNPLYKLYGNNFYLKEDNQKNLWIVLKRNKILFVSRFNRFSKSVDYLGGQTNKDLIEKNVNKVLRHDNFLFIFTKGGSVFKKEINSQKSELIFKSINVKEPKISKDYIVFISNDKVHYYSFKTGIVKPIRTNVGNVTTFDFLNAEEVLLSTGELVSLKIGLVTKICDIGQNVRFMNVFGNNMAVATSSDIHLFKIEKGIRKTRTVNQNHTNKLVKFSSNSFIWMKDEDGFHVCDNYGKSLGHYLEGQSIKELIVIGDLLISSTSNTIFLYKKQLIGGKNGLELIKKVNTNFNFINSQIQTICPLEKSLLIGTNNDLFEFSNSFLYNSTKFSPTLKLNGVYVNDKKIPTIEKGLKYYQNNLVFDFDAHSYWNYDDLQLIYSVKNYKDKFQYSSSSTINLENLPSGKYELKVYAISENKRSDPYIIGFEISPPFWKTIWFSLLVICFLIMLVGWIIRKSISLKEKKYKQKNELVELQFKALHSQLNPHFIFNALNSLQSVYLTKNELVANKYMVLFTKLLRGVLDNSRMTITSIKDEMDFLENYVRLQEFNFPNGIDYTFSCENVVSKSDTYVRSMIIQPIIENSFMVL